MKIAGSGAGVALVLLLTWALFRGKEITWLPPGAALIAALISGFVSLAFSYLTELRQRRFVLRALTQYVSKPVADELTRDPRKLSLGGQRREMTVMFTDLANFTALSETMDVERLAGMLNFYLQEMSEIILQQNGTLDKYIGDSIMSFWNAPLNQADHARLACSAALEMQRREALLQPQLTELAGGPVRSRTGINSGPMIFGNMGSSYKFDYTVLGDAVNLASRLEAANKIYGTKVLLSETTANYVHDRFVLRKIDFLRVKGRTQPMPVYELMGEGVFDPKAAELIKRYEQAFGLYQSRQFDAAWELLIPMAQDYAEDGPTATLLARVLQYREAPPPDDWDGVFTAKEK
jgi:adenylate cyclase